MFEVPNYKITYFNQYVISGWICNELQSNIILLRIRVL